jgi:hypothetical protein
MKMYTKLSIFLSILALTAQNTVISMERDESVQEYRTYNGKEINAETIGTMALSHALPLQDVLDVTEWRDQNRGILAQLVDFSHKNSEFREHFEKNKQALKDSGLNNQGGLSYIFTLPNNDNLFIQVSGPINRLYNLKEIFLKHEPQLKKEHLDLMGKRPTFQTVSRFAYYLRFLDTAEKNNFVHFKVPATGLAPLNNNQPKQEYSDENSFVIQERLQGNWVSVKDNKNKLHDVNQQAFKEVLTAIQPVALWDQSNLLIDENGNLAMTNLQQGNNANPDFFLHKNEYMFNHLACCGFKGIYDLADQEPELQHQIQNYVRDNLQLVETQYSNDQQKDLENHLKINQ